MELESDSGSAYGVDEEITGMGFLTLDDFDVEGKRILLRVDINSPVDEKTLMLEDGSKILSSVPTIRELLDRGAKVAVLAHQGRPGDYDFIPLNEHATYLSRYLGGKVRYIDDIYGAYALKVISRLGERECILLKNVRYFSQEQLSRTPDEHSKSDLVRTLAPEFDLFVNDAFGSSHRSHASLVGFSVVMPAAAGRLLEKEVRTLTRVFRNPRRPSTYIFGGKKLSDAVQVIGRLAPDENVDHILIAGLAGYGFQWCMGKKVGSGTEDLIKADIIPAVADEARRLCEEFPDKICLPSDAAIEEGSTRAEYRLEDLPDEAAILDIGPFTINEFSRLILESETVFLSGPPGVYEREHFDKGTIALYTAMTDSGAFSVIGGGHSGAAANRLGLMDKFSYCSTGGGALERLMLHRPMPVIEALRRSAARY